jgi:hypothetical protein
MININNNSNNYFQNLITYELERSNTHVGFGFDLKGDRPAIVGSVRKGSIAEKVGLREGDLVISINNKKVTDLDHDQVVRHIGLTKNRLILQITKIRFENIQKNNNNTKHGKINDNLMNYKNENKISKKNPSSKLYNESTKNHISKEKIPLTTAANNLYYIKNDTLDSLTNNTKTTEDDEEDSDIDYDFFLMTGRRRQRRHHHHHHYHHHNHRHSKKQSNRNLMVKTLQKPVSSSCKQLSNSADEFVNDENIDYENNDDYEHEDETEDTEDTEDTEGNLNPLNDYKKKCKIFT